MTLTSVILLANPAHQSALNIRKALIIDAFDTATDISLARALKQTAASELLYVAALLSVKQCSKVFSLWYYRRTLLSIVHCDLSCGEGISTPKSLRSDEGFVEKVELRADAMQNEVDLASRACSIYPRNYYAWYHRSLCIQSCIAVHTRSQLLLRDEIPNTGLSDTNKSLHPSSTELEEVLTKELSQSRLWIERHVSDFSAVDHVCRVAEALSSLSPRTLSSASSPGHKNKGAYASIADSSIQHSLDLLKAYPSHESLWLYLRRALLFIKQEQDSDLWNEADATVQVILSTASSSCQTGSDMGSIIRESHSTIRHAVRFTIWRRRHIPESNIGHHTALSACSHFNVALSTKDDISLMRLVSSIS